MCTFKWGGASLEDTNQKKKKQKHQSQTPPMIVTRDIDNRFIKHFRGVDKGKIETGVMDPRACYYDNEDSPTHVTRDVYGLSRGRVRQYEL